MWLNTLDQSGDLNGQRLYAISRRYEMPEYVKEASSNDINGSPDLPERCYAAQAPRAFPQHTKAATWISYAFLLDAKKELQPHVFSSLTDRLKQASTFFGIHDDLSALDSAHQKAANCPDKPTFALDMLLPSGERILKYPLRNISEIKQASAYLQQHYKELPLKARQIMADTVLTKLAEMQIDVSEDETEFLTKQAGLGVCAAKAAADLVQTRATVLRRQHPDVAEDLDAITQICVKEASLVRDSKRLRGLACVIDDIDQTYGLTDYGPTFQRPEDVLFAVTPAAIEKYASSHFAMPTGEIYAKADLLRVSPSALRDVFGDSFVNRVAIGDLELAPDKFAAVIQDAQLEFDTQFCKDMNSVFKAAGVHPVDREPAHRSGWLDKDTLNRLAR